ncbi:MAG: class I SAM-dependent methyltransferase, partial [Brasilonema sp.]
MLNNDSLTQRVNTYQNTLECNESLYLEFTQLVAKVPFLENHRNHIEANDLGFGDRAFHYMWLLLLQYIADKFSHPKFLEIGVYKGQVISLLALIASQLNIDISITAISPLKGNPRPKSSLLALSIALFNAKFRENLRFGNFYENEDYLSIVSNLFESFHLDFTKIRMIKGYSNNELVIQQIKDEKFSVVYIDGDHTFEGVTQDINNYALKVEKGGFLVMDDASYY